jgi:DNA-directed RNA polymerase subunit RPC12/RpoP
MTGVASANQLAPDAMFSEYRLRCSACGAPYSPTSEGEILTCDYCGTSQRIVDARQFLDHFMAQVTAFVRQAVPPGLDVSGSQHVDPMARLAAFNTGIRPHLSTESDQYRFSCFQLLASPLATLPFTSSLHPAAGENPAAVSIFAAKVQSISGLAVDDSSRELIRRASGLASCYQSLLVATKLSGSNHPERFHLVSQNFATASEAIASTGRWPALAARLAGLTEECKAVDQLVTGRDFELSRKLLQEAERELKAAQTALASIPELGYMTTAVEQELAVVRMVNTMINLFESSPNVPPHPLAYLQRLGSVLDWLSRTAPSDWITSFRSLRFQEEIFRRAAEVRAAQSGRGAIKMLNVGGGTFVPFWVVELPYTFETGVLWTKRGKEVPEVLLVAATFPTNLSTLSGVGASRVLTDVFSALQGNRPLNSYYGRLSGKEQKISESGGLSAILQGVGSYSIPGQQAIPPLTTEAEVLRLVQLYVNEVRSTNPKASTQLRASSPRVLDLVYLPCVLHASPPVPWLGGLSPASLGDPQPLLGFVS